MINQIFSQLSNLIKKPMFRKVQFDYLGFYKFLRDNKENELIISLLNGVNLEKDYSLEINRKLEEVFMSLIEFMINKDSKILDTFGISQVVNKIRNELNQQNFNEILKILNSEINLKYFRKFLIWINHKLKISSSSMKLILLLSILVSVPNNRVNADEVSTISSEYQQENMNNIPQKLTESQISEYGTGIQNGMEEEPFKLVISNPNLTYAQFWAFRYGTTNKMEEWYFKLVISNPNLTNNQLGLFKLGAKNKMEKWYFRLVISNPNLTNNQLESFEYGATNKMRELYFKLVILGIKNKMEGWYFKLVSNPNLIYYRQFWAFRYGTTNKMEEWYFKLVISNPNLTNNQLWLFKFGAKNKMEKWYFEKIPNLTDSQSKAFEVGARNNLGRKYFELITDKIKVQTIQQINDYDKPTSFDTSVFSLIEILNILENSNINKKKLNKVTYSFLDEFTFYVNELHNDRFEDRKKPFLDANIRTLYILLSFGGELYTSSFRDIIFPLFKQKVEQEGFFDLIDRIDPDKEYYNDLIYHVSSYRLLDEIVPLNIVSQEEFIKSLFHNFMKDSSKDIDSLISLTSIIETFSNSDSYIRKKIFSYALDMYPKLKHPKSTFIAYIILENEDFVKKNFNNKIGAKLRQEIETLRPLKSGKINEILNQNENFLQNNELKTIQVFYSDSDGVLSLNSFIKTVKYHGYSFSYIDEDDLKVQIENPNHNMVSKLKGKTITAEKVVNGIRILHELRVYDSTYESFYIENFNKNSSYISWIHRGHSYHFNKTFDYHGENFQRDKPMILILGSCGSFNNVTNLFKRTKKDRFFATQGIGTLIINNSLILNLFESIANTKGDISWEKVSYDLKRDIFDKDKRGGEYQTPYSLPMRMLQLFNMGVEEN